MANAITVFGPEHKRLIVTHNDVDHKVGYHIDNSGVHTILGEEPEKHGFTFRYLPEKHESELKKKIVNALVKAGVPKEKIEFHPAAFGKGFDPKTAPTPKRPNISP